MLVRWIGAFGKSNSLSESLKFELSRAQTDEVCAESLINGVTCINHAKIGLSVPRTALIKSFSGDVWSEYQEGKLVKTRKPNKKTHNEMWVHPTYNKIVVQGFDGLKKSIKQEIKYFSRKYNLEIVKIK